MTDQVKALDELLIDAVLGRMLIHARKLHAAGLTHDQMNAALPGILAEEEAGRKAIREWAMKGLREPRIQDGQEETGQTGEGAVDAESRSIVSIGVVPSGGVSR